jgi:hypothetical protein
MVVRVMPVGGKQSRSRSLLSVPLSSFPVWQNFKPEE